VNGIAVQAKVYGPFLHTSELPHIEKTKQRSVSVENEELDVYVAGTRVGPPCLVTRESYSQESQLVAEVAHKKNLLWVMARKGNQEYQVIPSWTGFHIRTRNQVSISEDVVGFLPTTNAPATEMNTVFEILNRSALIRRELLVETIVVVMDQALYAKSSRNYLETR